MAPPLSFFLGFMCCGLIVILYLLYRLIEVLKEFVMILKDELIDK